MISCGFDINLCLIRYPARKCAHHAMPLPPTRSTLGSGAMPNTLATYSAPVQIHFSPCHILVLISRTSSPLPNNRSHPAGPSIGSWCQHLKVIIPNLWHPGVYSYIMMGKTTCPQRQRTFLRCLPICFGGAAHFGPNSEWQAGNFFFSATGTSHSGSHWGW